jgi:hypothetical protein
MNEPRFLTVMLVFLIALATVSVTHADHDPNVGATPDHLIVLPTEIVWKPLHPGSEIAVLSGDPKKDGVPFVLRIRYRGKVIIPPHWHPTDENITVLKGTFFLAMGEHYDELKGVKLTPGGYALLQKKMAHFAWAEDDAIVQVHGVGPFTINYINPADDPNRISK